MSAAVVCPFLLFGTEGAEEDWKRKQTVCPVCPPICFLKAEEGALVFSRWTVWLVCAVWSIWKGNGQKINFNFLSDARTTCFVLLGFFKCFCSKICWAHQAVFNECLPYFSSKIVAFFLLCFTPELTLSSWVVVLLWSVSGENAASFSFLSYLLSVFNFEV